MNNIVETEGKQFQYRLETSIGLFGAPLDPQGEETNRARCMHESADMGGINDADKCGKTAEIRDNGNVGQMIRKWEKFRLFSIEHVSKKETRCECRGECVARSCHCKDGQMEG